MKNKIFLVIFLLLFIPNVKAYNDTNAYLNYDNVDFVNYINVRGIASELEEIKNLCASEYQYYMLSLGMYPLNINTQHYYFCNEISPNTNMYYYFNNKGNYYRKSMKQPSGTNTSKFDITFYNNQWNKGAISTGRIDFFLEVYGNNHWASYNDINIFEMNFNSQYGDANVVIPIYSNAPVYYNANTNDANYTSHFFVNGTEIANGEEIPFLFNKKQLLPPTLENLNVIYLTYNKQYQTIGINFITNYNNCYINFLEQEQQIACDTISYGITKGGLYDFYIKDNNNNVVAKNSIDILLNNINSPYATIDTSYNYLTKQNNVIITAFNQTNYKYKIDNGTLIDANEPTTLNFNYDTTIYVYIYDNGGNLIYFTYKFIPYTIYEYSSTNNNIVISDFLSNNNNLSELSNLPIFVLINELNNIFFGTALSPILILVLVFGIINMILSLINSRKGK